MQGIFESNGKTERETLADQAVRFEGQRLIYICEKIKVKGKEVMEKKERGNFTGTLGFVMAAAGSAVGLGNVWRFPYLAAKDNGGVFIFIYVILALTFGLHCSLRI